MSKKNKAQKKHSFPWWMAAPLVLVVAIVVALQLRKNKEVSAVPGQGAPTPAKSAQSTASLPPATTSPPAQPTAPPAPPPLLAAPTPSATDEGPIEVNTARMVTVELDFGGQMPSIAEALTQVERRYQPDDGAGRTFAILDAYGMPTNNNKLHLSMHLSMEKPGVGSLVFKKTGEVLWEGKIVKGTNSSQFSGKNLLILVDNGEGQGRSWTIDGSSSPLSILDATVKENHQPLRDLWPDGTDREFTYLYSACGCPVKAMVRRHGDRTVRTSDQPVMFPDDPAALQVIKTLMQWDH